MFRVVKVLEARISSCAREEEKDHPRRESSERNRVKKLHKGSKIYRLGG